ncbi:hypothetical protein FACS189443_0940 [Planctomycetales bacterium]|nr:hypothetical protein FACS189443_0940 [Planctomycetales bacterium]
MSGLFVRSNVQSLIAQHQITRTVGDLSNILTRLSTGLRINSGKDDPAGLIASELMKSDITATTKAISNAQRANSMIAIADSAMGQVSNLLNDIRALVNEAANTGAMSAEQIAANQMQVDASLDSIDRIAKTTNYQGRLLLDGSMDFSTAGLSKAAVKDLSIYQANFGTQSQLDITIDVMANAERGQLFYDKAGISNGAIIEVVGNLGNQVFNFEAGASVAAIATAVNQVSDSTGVQAIVGRDATNGQIMLTSAGLDNDINLTALWAGAAAGNYSIKFSAGNDSGIGYTITEPANGQPGIIDFKIKMQPTQAPSVANFDESFNGLYSYDITGGYNDGTNDVRIAVESKNGTQIRQIVYVPSSSASVTQASGVASTFNKATGVLQIQYDANAGYSLVTEENLRKAIGAIDGLEYKGVYVGNALQTTAATADPLVQAFLDTMTPVTAVPRTKTPIDLRANNALDIRATVNGSKFENTDIVYVKGVGAADNSKVYSELVNVDGTKLYLGTDPNVVSGGSTPPDGWKIVFTDGGSAALATSSADASTKTVTIGLIGTTTLANIENILNGAITTTGTPSWAAGYSFDFKDASGVAATDTVFAKSLIGTTLTMDDVHLKYSDSPSAAAATIQNTTEGYTIRLASKSIGADYNDVRIVFENTTNGYNTGEVTSVYDEAKKILHIRGDLENATLGSVKAAVDANSPFVANITDTATGAAYALSNQFVQANMDAFNFNGQVINDLATLGTTDIRTGQITGDIGTSHQTLFITVADDSTAADVVNAFDSNVYPTISANFIVNPSNNGSGTIFSAMLDTDVAVRSFTSALKGGSDGFTTNTTAKELVDFINSDSRLSELFLADLARNQVGAGFITLFDEAAYYGSVIDDNALQFLGPKDSPDVLFVSDGPNSPLYITFEGSQEGFVSDSRPIASLNATNANASFSVQSVKAGDEYDDMVVRMIRLDNNHSAADSYAQYKAGPSNAMAYCSINDVSGGTMGETGKFIVYGSQGGAQLNDVSVVAKLDENQTVPAMAVYDEASKRLIVTVNSRSVTLSDAVSAINKEGTFHAEYDYSWNTDPTAGLGSTGPGLDTFLNTFGAGLEVEIGNTGTTGGHNGVLEVYVGGTATEITAQRVVDTINSNEITGKIFNANTIGNGTGVIDFRKDNIHSVVGADGKKRNEVNMVTDILGSSDTSSGYMVVHLATDNNGTILTTAKDLVAYFDTLTPEQTRGISVSVIRPPGVDNLDRVWTYDNCGNIIETQLCDDPYGLGLLAPTMLIDDCGNITYMPIEFYSFGEDLKPGNAYGSVIAANGVNASLDIHAKVAGPEYNGVGFQYLKLDDPLAAPYAEYDAANKKITVYIQENETAAQIKSVIENSEQTKNLFTVTLTGDGSEPVSLQDDYLVLRNGIYDAGYRGGAVMQGAADADEHRLVFESINEGSSQYVSVRALGDSEFVVRDAAGNTTDTDYGEDMVARLNGNKMTGEGRTLGLDTSMLKIAITLDEKVTGGDRVQFTVTGGGATYQIGPDVVTNQQIRVGIQSVNTAKLGGASGRLYQLRSGEVASLTGDTKLADRIVQEAIMAVAVTRGRLGAIQRSTLDPTIAALQDSLEATTSAESQISNADFAEESSKLTRAQILVQSGIQALQIANQFPQYAASLLGG